MRLVTRLIAVWAITTFVSSTIPYAHGQPKPVRLITHGIDDRELVVLRGNTHPMARPQFDRGAAPNTLPMERMLLVLKRSPEQEAALEKFMDEQLDRTSVNYHRWLTPEEFGQQFGPAEQDIEAVSSWLKSCGFLVTNVSKSRRVMEFSGTAGEILATFHAAIHKYVVDGD